MKGGSKLGTVKGVMKTTVAVHDLSCHAKSSLTVVIPALSALGIEASVLPTALLSTQTDGFEHYSYLDLTSQMEDILAHWEKLELSFDAMYSGFLGSEQQIEIVLRLMEDQRTLAHPFLAIVDPVLGDQGKPYGPVSPQLVKRMGLLVSQADVITPNITEAALLLGKSYNEHMSVDQAKEWAQQLSALGPRYVAITSIMEKQHGVTVAYDNVLQKTEIYRQQYVPISYPGCGDLFASIVCGLMVNGTSFASAVDQGGALVRLAVERSYQAQIPQRMGVAVELIMKELCCAL